jgi:hypothetical protein
MFTPRRRSGLVLALGLAIAYAAPIRADQPSLSDLAQARFDAASKLYDTTWSYYRQKRAGAPSVYFASIRLLAAELDLSARRDKHIAAHEHHFSRVKKLQDLVLKIKDLGRANNMETVEVTFFVAEAEYWLAISREPSETEKRRERLRKIDHRSVREPARSDLASRQRAGGPNRAT